MFLVTYEGMFRKNCALRLGTTCNPNGVKKAANANLPSRTPTTATRCRSFPLTNYTIKSNSEHIFWRDSLY